MEQLPEAAAQQGIEAYRGLIENHELGAGQVRRILRDTTVSAQRDPYAATRF